MAQISNNRTQVINKLMRRFNLSQQQLIAVAAVVVLAVVSGVVLIGIISAGTSESFDRSHNQAELYARSDCYRKSTTYGRR